MWNSSAWRPYPSAVSLVLRPCASSSSPFPQLIHSTTFRPRHTAFVLFLLFQSLSSDQTNTRSLAPTPNFPNLSASVLHRRQPSSSSSQTFLQFRSTRSRTINHLSKSRALLISPRFTMLSYTFLLIAAMGLRFVSATPPACLLAAVK